MKLPLWILNSSLLVICIITLLVNLFLKQEAPALRIRKSIVQEEQKKQPMMINFEKIYKQDIFDTFIAVDKAATPKNFVTPVPQPKQPVFTPPPLPQKPKFVQALNISLKGIIASSNESKSVAMIADETNKEKVYHIGDTIKDGQILKVDKDKVIILRANGQQEMFLLRKKEELPGKKPEDTWKYIAKKIDEQNYEIDPKEFCQKITSLADFMENLSLKTAYKQDKPAGLQVGKIEDPQMGNAIGIKQNDILLAINGINTKDFKDRIKIYDHITSLQKGETIKLDLQRNNQKQKIKYKLTRIGKPSKKAFIEAATEEGQPPAFKTSKEQQREKEIRQFEKIHKEPKNSDLMSNIRKRLLKNMRSRLKDRRVR